MGVRLATRQSAKVTLAGFRVRSAPRLVAGLALLLATAVPVASTAVTLAMGGRTGERGARPPAARRRRDDVAGWPLLGVSPVHRAPRHV